MKIELIAKYKNKMTKKHNKLYYEQGRNGYTMSDTINPKMKLSKEELGLKDNRIPNYYIGKNGYEARKVIDNFDLSYNVGTATTYLLRCGKKKEQGMTDNEKHIEDIQKSINHLQFEIERLKE